MTKKKHEDTKVSLHPLSFEEAIQALSHSPKRKDSEAVGSDNTKEHAPESGTSKKRTSQRWKSSGG